MGLGDVEGFKGQRVEPGVVGFGADGHGGGGEVLHLFEVEVELLGFGSQLCHVGQRASGVTADEVGDELVVEMLFATDAVEESFEIVEEPEGRLAHEVEHLFGGVLGSHFQSSAHMSGDELAGVLTGGLVDVGGTCLVKQKVVAHTAADERFLDARQCVDGVVEVEQRPMVGVEVGAYLGVNA